MFASAALALLLAAPPEVGEPAPAADLQTLEGEDVTLESLTEGGPAVVVVLRGYPGYQCPICRGQVNGFMKASKKFEDAGAKVVMIYPGDVDDLDAKAKQFLGTTELPEHFRFVLDPDFAFTNAWDLRWDAPRETAYPSAFLLDSEGKVRAAKVSKAHGGRVTAEQALAELAKI